MEVDTPIGERKNCWGRDFPSLGVPRLHLPHNALQSPNEWGRARRSSNEVRAKAGRVIRCGCLASPGIHGASGSAPSSQPPRCSWLHGFVIGRPPLLPLTRNLVMERHDLHDLRSMWSDRRPWCRDVGFQQKDAHPPLPPRDRRISHSPRSTMRPCSRSPTLCASCSCLSTSVLRWITFGSDVVPGAPGVSPRTHVQRGSSFAASCPFALRKIRHMEFQYGSTMMFQEHGMHGVPSSWQQSNIPCPCGFQYDPMAYILITSTRW